MIIDFHTHVFPDKLAVRVLPLLAERSKITYHTDGTTAGLRSSMKKNSINASVLLQIATKPEQTHTVNSWAIEQNSRDIIAFGSIHPLYENWKEEIDRLSSAGIKGIKLHPDYQGFYPDEDFMRPIYEYVISKGLIISFHSGVDIGLPDPVHCDPDRIMKMYDILKHGTIVLAHGGAWNLWHIVESELVGTNFYFDTAFCAGYIREDVLQRIIINHGFKKILFASDSPWEDQAESLKLIRNLSLSEEAENAVLGGNAERILGLKRD